MSIDTKTLVTGIVVFFILFFLEKVLERSFGRSKRWIFVIAFALLLAAVVKFVQLPQFLSQGLVAGLVLWIIEIVLTSPSKRQKALTDNKWNKK